MTHHRRLRAVGLLLALAACKDLNVPDYNAGSLTSLEQTPTRSSVATAAQGMLASARNDVLFLVQTLGVLGRESYDLDVSNPQNTNRRYVNLTPDVAQNFWSNAYRTIRLGNVLLHAVDGVKGVSDEEKEGLRGFTKTIQALEFLNLISALDSSGAAIDVDVPATGALAPIVPKAQVYARILQLLDAAAAHLDKAGAAFPFQMSAGFAAFATPAIFRQLNRAIRARADIFLRRYPDALTDLSASFIAPSQPLDLGAYHTFSANSGDTPNPLFDPQPRQLFPIPADIKEGRLRPDGGVDLRVARKLAPIDPKTVIGVDVDSRFQLYGSQNAATPVIRNEELILMRAEARWFTGDAAGALADINVVRTTSGGLAPRGPFAGEDDFVTELLYNRRYSLLWEGGFRWLDARRFDRWAQLPRLQANFKFFPWVPIPTDECIARSPAPPGCTLPPGL